MSWGQRGWGGGEGQGGDGSESDLINGAPLENALHRTKDLVCGNDVVILHIAEDSRLDVVALVSQPLPATLQFGALLFPLFAHLQDLVKLFLRHLHQRQPSCYCMENTGVELTAVGGFVGHCVRFPASCAAGLGNSLDDSLLQKRCISL